jgi:hypothetical protein
MKKVTAGLGIAALVAVAALVPATAASAHDAGISGTSVCQDDGTQLVTVTVTTSNVPGDALGEVKVITPENRWLFEWPEHAANHGLPPLAANASFTYDLTVAGDATSVATSVQIDWSDGYSHDPGTTIDLPGDCAPDVPEEPEPVVVTPLPPTVDCDGVSIPDDTESTLYTAVGYTVTASAKPGFIFDTPEGPAGAITWMLVAPDDCETPPTTPPTTPEESTPPTTPETPTTPSTPDEPVTPTEPQPRDGGLQVTG